MSISSNKITTGTVVGPGDPSLFSTKVTNGVIVGRESGTLFSSKITIGVIVGPLPPKFGRRRMPLIIN